MSVAVQRDLAEDAEDLTAFQERKDERAYSFEIVVHALRERGRRRSEEGVMKHEFTAIFERDGDWYIAFCPEIPGANGQGKTKSEARENLADAIALILEDRREDGLRGLPDDVERETVTLE